MSHTVTELFNGGLVTARIGALLNSGELQRLDDCLYREKDPAIWRAPGRTTYNASAITVSGSAQAVKGLGYLTFNGYTDQLLVLADGTLFRSDFTALTGSFSEISTPGKIAGVVSAATTFTATSGNPFTADVVGARCYSTASTSGVPIVTATSGSADANGRFASIIVDRTITGTVSMGLDWGVVLDLTNAGTETLGLTRWDNQYFVWNGVDDLRRVSWRRRGYLSGSPLSAILVARPCGLAEVVAAPTVTTTAGTWSALLDSGVFWFLITEIYAPSGDVAAAERDPYLASEVIEAAYLGIAATSNDPNNNKGRPIPQALTKGGSTVPVITFPAVVNDGTRGRLATNWGIYMAGPTQTTTDVPSLASFRRVATPAITETSKTLTESALLPQSKFPTVVAAGFGSTIVTNSARILGANDNSFTGVDNSFGISQGDTPGHAARVSTFAFDVSGGYASAAIVGIEVTVRARARSGSAFIDVQVGTSGGKRGATYMKDFSHQLFSPAGTITVGGPTDTMGAGIVIGDLATFQVDVGIEGGSIAFDSVKVTLYFAGGTVNLEGPAYRVVTYRDQVGLTVNDPANLAPPICSTVEVWQGSLVMNDVNVDGALRFSIAGRPEAVPKPYVLKFRDRSITQIVDLGHVLLVGMRSTLKRVNYLPRETDTDLTSGLAWEDIAPDHGLPGPYCGAKFAMPGKGTMFAYASASGMFITNGIWTIPLNMDLDWANTVKVSALATAVLRVHAKERLLAFYYCPAGATHDKNTRVLYFCYQADKIKGDYGMPAVGPCVVSGRSSAQAYLNGDYLLSGHEVDGKVYVEDAGLSVPSGYQVRLNDDSANGDGKTAAAVDVKIVPFIRTRKFYSATLDRDGYGEKVYLLFSAYGSNSVTASSTTTLNSTTITSSVAFGSVVPGMRVLGTGIDPGTIVVSKSDSSTILVSRAANLTGIATLTFDTGTVAVTVRGSSLGEIVKGLRTDYVSTLVGDLTGVINSNMRRGFEIQVEKVPLTFDSNGDTLTWADLSTNMRLHSISYVVSDRGLPDTNRNAA